MKWIFAPAVAGLLAAGCGNEPPAAEPVRPVVTLTVSRNGVDSGDVYSGELRARYETDVAFRVGGKLVARLVDAGARVKRGQPLARLDPEDARLAAGAARAQLASAQSDFALAQAELDRNADLLAKKFISASAFDAKRNAFNAAQAKLEQSRSQSSITDNQAAYTTLTADADGVVLSIAAEPGQVVSAGQPVLRLARAGEREVLVNAPEGRLARLHVGQDVAVSLWADPSRPFPGRVREIAGGADPVTRTFAVRVGVSGLPEGAQLGMTATVAVPAPAGALVVLPLSALAGDAKSPAVWVVDPKTSRVRLRAVTVAQFREDGAAIASGLEEGDVVVTAGAHKLRADQVVRRVAPI